MSPASTENSAAPAVSRRRAIQGTAAAVLAGGVEPAPSTPARPWLKIRGIYGGFPQEIVQRGQTPADYGINAVWVGSGRLNAADIDRYHQLGVKVFAEFNSMHAASYLKDHPDAAPIGPDGKPSPPPHGWQGVSPFHAGYRRDRMDEFRRILKTFEIDGIWLDYHHAHASWERAEPSLPDTGFSAAALRQFSAKTGIQLPADTKAAARLLLGKQQDAWTRFRCEVFTDWVREYREVLEETRPKALLGTFHCPWSPDDYDGAIRHKLAIDLSAQAKFLDVFSIMPYHARFGHAKDPAWIARQTKQLGELLQTQRKPKAVKQIWPIVQLSDWGESVPVQQVAEVLDYGSRQPASGIMVFHWSGITKQWEKVEALRRAYLSYRPT